MTAGGRQHVILLTDNLMMKNMKKEQTQNQIVQERSKEKSVSEKTERVDE